MIAWHSKLQHERACVRSRIPCIKYTHTHTHTHTHTQVRVEEFGDLVAGMILVEANQTFQGHPKPLHYPAHAHRLPAAARSKIRHVLAALPPRDAPGAAGVTDVTDATDAWTREFLQRDSIVRGLPELAPGGAGLESDLVLVSDVDEIPKRAAVRLLRVCHGARELNPK